ncbi:phage tail protein [Streptomyces sp. NPDC005813]|uniref:phage tail protein n=1 Tax=Streptomyces sp. NPDC005813 TaxID=3155592 RepID=UPI0033CD6839
MNLGDLPTDHRFVIELGRFPVETVQRVTGADFDQDVVAGRCATPAGLGVAREQPGPPHGEVTVVRGSDKSPAFTDWVDKTLVDQSLGSARQDVTLVELDADRNPVRRIKLSNAWAAQWTTPSFQSGGGPAMEQVTIAFEQASVE